MTAAERSPADRFGDGPHDWTRWWAERSGVLGERVPHLSAGRTGSAFVVASAELMAAGWQPHDVRREIRRGTRSAPARGVASPIVVTGDAPAERRRRHALAAAAAGLARPDQVVCCRSGAVLFGLPTMRVPGLPELLAARAVTRGRRSAAHVRAAGLTPAEVTRWFGTPVTTVARTLVDLARHDRFDAIMAADAALRAGLVTRRRLDASLARASGWPGVQQARDVLATADPLAESPIESITRLVLLDAGLPAPVLQAEIVDPRQRFPWRVDFLWPAARLVLEADGRFKYDRDELWREKVRETRLRALGYRVERVIWDDVTRFLVQTTDRLARLLHSR